MLRQVKIMFIVAYSKRKYDVRALLLPRVNLDSSMDK